MGVRVKPGGKRPLQPVTNRFFYWLRATTLETRRLGFWWLERMVTTNRPLEEKMALFWHGHFATSEEKLRDYRKIQLQLETLRKGATGSFADLLVAVAKDPAMLVFLDAAQNVKGAPNENFGREVMELFTMGVGNYTEDDIREAARAFTGWGNDDLTFVIDAEKHDGGIKKFLGREGNFTGEDILRIILEQPQTAIYVASKLYRFFVREDVSPAFAERLGALLRDGNYEIAPFLRTIFLSEDFYSEPSVAHPHQVAGGADRLDLPQARARCAARHPRSLFGQQDARTGAALSPHRRRLGPGPLLDHPGAAVRARQFRPRGAVPQHHRFRRPQP